MLKKTIFSKIINKELHTEILYQDDKVTAFYDNNPQAPVHILIVTNIIIPTVNDVLSEHEIYLGRMFIVASRIARQQKIDKDGYRLVVNCNKHGGQKINHLHMHLLGGKMLKSFN